MSDELRKAVSKACGAVAAILVVRQVRRAVQGTGGIVLGMLAGSVMAAGVTTAVDGLLARSERGLA
jgi:hypothetical protein